MNVKRKRIKSISPYAKIDWNKAKTLFVGLPSPSEKKDITVKTILSKLASAADKGMVFMFNASNPAIAEYLLEGTGPLNWKTHSMIKRLQKQHDVTVTEDDDGKVTVKITKHGLTRALSYRLDSFSLQRATIWDGKWREVIFDIPDHYRRVRDLFRMRLVQLGLYRLQESVYISPYKCFDEVEFLRELYGIPFTVRYLLVEQLEDDGFLRRHFNLIS